MAASYLVLGSFTRSRIKGDARALFGFVALSVFFLTLAVPLHLKMHGVTLAWAIEGPVLLYLGYRYKYFPVRAGGLIVLAAAVVHLFARHWPLHEMLFVPLFNRHFASAMFVPMAGAAYAIIHHRMRSEGGEHDRLLKIGAAIASGALAIVVLHVELKQWLTFQAMHYEARCVVAMVWVLGAAAYLVCGFKLRSAASRTAGLIAMAIAALTAARLYGREISGYALFFNGRFVASLVVVALVFGAAYAWWRLRDACPESEWGWASRLGWVGVWALFLLLSFETYRYFRSAIADYDEARWTAQMALSIVWGLYATALLVVGFRRRIRSLRLCGLALFGLTALKLTFVDMAQVEQIYRVLSFLALGALLMAASYLYHRVEKTMAEAKPHEESA
jgi:uncharacterized membrane protein